MHYYKCEECGKLTSATVRQVCPKGCGIIRKALEGITPSEILLTDLNDAVLLDPTTCEPFKTEAYPEPLTGCDLIIDAIGSEAAAEKELSEIELIDLVGGLCARVLATEKSFCEKVQDEISGVTPEIVAQDAAEFIDALTCERVTLEPAKDACTRLSEESPALLGNLMDLNVVGWDGSDNCGTIQLRCCGSWVEDADREGSDTFTIPVGQQRYNTYTEGGDNETSLVATKSFTNNQTTPVIVHAFGSTRLSRSTLSALEKVQIINYMGPESGAPTGTGNDTALGTLSFSGVDEFPDLSSEISYIIDEVPRSPDGYGVVFNQRPTYAGSLEAESYEFNWAKSQRTVHHLEPGESVDLILTSVVALNEDVVGVEEFALEHDLFIRVYEQSKEAA